jgi:hypothetical protein
VDDEVGVVNVERVEEAFEDAFVFLLRSGNVTGSVGLKKSRCPSATMALTGSTSPATVRLAI